MLPLFTSAKISKHNHSTMFSTLETKPTNTELFITGRSNEGEPNSYIETNNTDGEIQEGKLAPNCFGNPSTSQLCSFEHINDERIEDLKFTLTAEISAENNENTAVSHSTSFSSRLSEKLTAVAEKLSLKLSRSVLNGNASGIKPYKNQNVEKVSLVPTFFDDGTTIMRHDSSLSINLLEENLIGDNLLLDDRQCRICLMQIASETGKKSFQKNKKLISPCRCAGTVQYVHISCLTHWIEVSSRKIDSVPKCELCGYKFRRKPFINLTQVHFPYVDWCDRILNCLFVFLVAIMILCAWVAIYYLRILERKPFIRPHQNSNVKRFPTDNDVTVIIASILFFAAFFIALFTQYRAEVTVFRIFLRMWATNRNWQIRNYDIRLDAADNEDEELGLNFKRVNNNGIAS